MLTGSSTSKCSSCRASLLGVGASSPLAMGCHIWVQPNHTEFRAGLEIIWFRLGIPQQIPHQGGCFKGLRTLPHIVTSACSWPRRARGGWNLSLGLYASWGLVPLSPGWISVVCCEDFVLFLNTAFLIEIRLNAKEMLGSFSSQQNLHVRTLCWWSGINYSREGKEDFQV